MNKKILYFEINGTGAVYNHSGMSGMSKTVRLRIQTAKVSFLCRVAGLYCSIRDGARTPGEPLLLHVGTSQLKWFGHLVRTCHRHLPLEVFSARPGLNPESAGETVHPIWPGNASGGPGRCGWGEGCMDG